MTTKPLFSGLALALLLTGCATNRWAKNYEPRCDLDCPPTDPSEIVFEQSIDLTRNTIPEMSGFQVLGISEFRGPPEKYRPGSKGSGLRNHAAAIGAHHVRWAEFPFGYPGVIMVAPRSRTVGRDITADYKAVYYRRNVAEMNDTPSQQ